MGLARLLAHVVKCWQPSWHEFAGALLTPPNMIKEGHSVAPRPHAEQQLGTGGVSNPSRPLAISNLATTVVHTDSYITPPSPLRPVLLPGPLSETEAELCHPRGTSASIVEEVDESQVSVNLQSSRQESVPAVELQASLRPRRQARDNALVKIRQVQGQPKKRPRSSDKNPSPGAKRRRAPAKRANEPVATIAEAEEATRDTTEVETTLQVVEEAVPPITGTPFHS